MPEIWPRGKVFSVLVACSSIAAPKANKASSPHQRASIGTPSTAMGTPSSQEEAGRSPLDSAGSWLAAGRGRACACAHAAAVAKPEASGTGNPAPGLAIGVTRTQLARSPGERIDSQGVLPPDTRHRQILDFAQMGQRICTTLQPPRKPEIRRFVRVALGLICHGGSRKDARAGQAAASKAG